jgi:hypothetical protein
MPDEILMKMYNAVGNQWPLVAAIIALGWWGFPHLLKKTLLNGGGDTIRNIVASCNADQSREHAEEMRRIVDDRIAAHEEVEAARFGKALTDAMSELRAEVTGEHALYPRPPPRIRPRSIPPTLRTRRRR